MKAMSSIKPSQRRSTEISDLSREVDSTKRKVVDHIGVAEPLDQSSRLPDILRDGERFTTREHV